MKFEVGKKYPTKDNSGEVEILSKYQEALIGILKFNPSSCQFKVVRGAIVGVWNSSNGVFRGDRIVAYDNGRVSKMVANSGDDDGWDLKKDVIKVNLFRGMENGNVAYATEIGEVKNNIVPGWEIVKEWEWEEE